MKGKLIGSVAVFSALLLLGLGCSRGGQERNYTIPAEVCDVPVAESAVEPLLPGGDSLTEKRPYSQDEGVEDFCALKVGKGYALTVSLDRDTGDGVDAMLASDDYSNLKRASFSGSVLSAGVGEDGAIVWLDCRPKSTQPQTGPLGGAYESLVMELRVGKKGAEVKNPDEQRQHIEDFVRAYLPGVEKTWCAGA
ncbi:hypothetical protein [Streptomyces flavalbus]|uniref:DUF3558 domain-containing protein n=1 Tax=Streptomyces flavalbus TaxID=2665155 RepID=A0ABW2W7J8_9ACTN